MKIVAPSTWSIACPDYDLTAILQAIDGDFHPSLSSQHNLSEFADKLQEKAHIFLAEEQGEISGVMAAYLNENADVYISFIIVLPTWRKRGIANSLLRALQCEARKMNCRSITCRVSVENAAARSMYKKADFIENGDVFRIVGISKIMVCWHNKDFK